MLYRIVVISIVFGLMVSCTSKTDQQNDTGIKLSENVEHFLSDLNGKSAELNLENSIYTLVDFWAVWCEPCIKAFPTINEIHNKYKENGLSVISIALDSGDYKDIAKILKSHNLDYPGYVGSDDIKEKYGVIGYPSYYILNPDGSVLKKYVGENMYNQIESDLDKLFNK